ncbi:undecaprenyl-phosphate glucose phosphotransferase [Arsenicitalea aurantiaca]|uniref:Undecaprenyl-phosphate glucose phosphotransferase n=1 Tax=Arsenicitalea aurantiaca TaxID=1783274 RepID=A0A433XEP0_9HYPH|nr:undecaprenyl-phosphate glucose phosphotransferase [Arsenicitalea aurantiaca]RUT32553.1 undecaprenyl-phosphate glucose phosphotransferase [Arsenicitalea aurantiaca]
MFRIDPKQAFAAHAARQTQTAGLSPIAEEIAGRPIEATLSAPVIVGIAQAVEALMIAALGYGIYQSYVSDQTDMAYVAMILGATLFANILFNVAQTHRIPAYRTVVLQIGRALAAWSIVFIALAVAVFLFKASDYVSRVWALAWFGTGAVSIVLFRLSLRGMVLHWTREGRLTRRTVIVGGGQDAASLIEAIRSSANSDIALYGLFDDREGDRSPDVVAGCPKLGKVADLAEFARRTRVDLVIVSMPLSAEKRVLEMLKQLWVLPVDIRLSAHMSQLRFTSRAYSHVGEVPVFDIADRPISDWNLVFKWLFDKSVAIGALVLLSPVMVATAIAIKLESPGPVFFRQKRHGFNNELIEIFKFRSMYTDRTDAGAARLVTRDDPRVTRVGRFIRKTSIDELPQLFNVLKGELSIVGPRPHALQAKADNILYYEAVEGYFARHRVKPGITGWAQIHGWRGETDTVEKIMQRVNHDLYYIENWSLLLDLQILVMTPVSLLSRSENAY